MNSTFLMGDEHKLYFSAFDFSNSAQSKFLIKRFLELSIDWTNNNNLAENGRQFSSFLTQLSQVAAAENFSADFKSELGACHIRASDDFLFELGGYIHYANINFQDFGSIIIKDYERRDFENKSMESPSVASHALIQLQKGKLVIDEDWKLIVRSCLRKLQYNEVESSDVIRLLFIVRLAMRFLYPSSLIVRDVFKSGQFFKNIKLEDTVEREEAYTSAVFIAKMINLDVQLDSKIFYQSVKILGNQFDEYMRFYKFYHRVKDLEKFQNDPINEI